jgi:hypothetical protein
MNPVRASLARLVPRPALDLLRLATATYSALAGGPAGADFDGMAGRRSHEFMRDARFLRAYAAGEKVGGFSHDVHWRAYIHGWAAECASHLSGDFVACGVQKVGYPRMIVDYVAFGGLAKRYWLVDAYSGLGASPETYDDVKRTFAGFPNVHLAQGVVPAVLPRIDALQIAYLALDLNDAVTEGLALEFLWERLVPGALVVFDHYGFAGSEAQKATHDRFARTQRASILALPTGQGLLIRP